MKKILRKVREDFEDRIEAETEDTETIEEHDDLVDGLPEDLPAYSENQELDSTDYLEFKAAIDASALKQDCIAEDIVEIKDRLLEAISVQTENLAEQSTRISKLQEGIMRDSILKPVLCSILEVFDVIWQQRVRMDRATDADGEMVKASRALQFAERRILEVLELQGVEIITGTTRKVDPLRQRVVRVAACKEGREGEVVSVCRKGFMKDGKVFRPEAVVVGGVTNRKEEVSQ